MVIGTTFAWAHLPKTGGDLTSLVFALFPEIVTHIDPTTAQNKHDPFVLRPGVRGGRTLALNIRRLPSWTVSFHQHMAHYGRIPDFVPGPMATAEEMVASGYGDDLLQLYVQNGLDRWFRQESLVDDLLEFIGELTTVDDERRQRVAALGRVNLLEYDHDIATWFDPEQIRTLYELNPLWAAAEEELYGSLLV